MVSNVGLHILLHIFIFIFFISLCRHTTTTTTTTTLDLQQRHHVVQRFFGALTFHMLMRLLHTHLRWGVRDAHHNGLESLFCVFFY